MQKDSKVRAAPIGRCRLKEKIERVLGTTTYTWDVRNRLVGIAGYDALCSPLSAAFGYDALGRRIRKTITTTDTVTDTFFVYDGLDIVQEKQTGTVTANYIRTLNIDEPLVRIKADGLVRYYQQDALGSVIAMTDETGAVKTTYAYDPFGNVTIIGESSDNSFQYTGRENDQTGLYYYRARYYSSELQRFISEDPIGLRGGINMFAYVHNQPVSNRDPLGLKGCGPGGDWSFGDLVIPDYPVGLPFKGCCDQHDKCYECQEGKDKCDMQFCFCLIGKCASGYRSLLPTPVPDCWGLALLYCRAVRDMGDEAYKRARVSQ